MCDSRISGSAGVGGCAGADDRHPVAVEHHVRLPEVGADEAALSRTQENARRHGAGGVLGALEEREILSC
jgi:hypothetical protein